MEMINFIIPCYNCSDTVEASVKSVFEVFGDNAAIICIDDCSTDETLQTLRKIENIYNDLEIITLDRNSGPGIARNYALGKISGWVSFLDADDYILPEFRNFFDIVLAENNKKILYVSGYQLHKDGKKLFEFFPPKTLSEASLLKQCPISCLSSVFYNDPRLGLRFRDAPREDLDFWHGLLFKWGFMMKSFNLAVGVYNLKRGSRSSQSIKVALNQFITINKYVGKSWHISLYCTVVWLFLGILKYRKRDRNATV